MKQLIKLSKLKTNPNNPRIIKDDKFKKLVQSIKDFPEMLELRPIVVDEDMIILGGNMRLKACKEAGLKEVHIKIAKGLTPEQKDEFIVKDNVGFGEWEWDILANSWDSVQLKDWGLDVWQNLDDTDLEDFFTEDNQDEKGGEKNKIILEYTEEEYNKILELFKKHSGTKEEIVYSLLSK
jgi:hypothetical protein